MKRFLIVAALGALSMLAMTEHTAPVEKVNVAVVVEPGDTLLDLVCDATENTGDGRYIWEVLHETEKYNGVKVSDRLQIGREIIIPCEVRR